MHESPALQKKKLPSYLAAQQAKLVADSGEAQSQQTNGGLQRQVSNGGVLDEADAYFASVGVNTLAVSANGDFASSPTMATDVRDVVNQGQGLGEVQPTMRAQNGEGDLLSL